MTYEKGRKKRPLRDLKRKKPYERALEHNIGPFSGKRTGKIPRKKLEIADPPAPAPKRRVPGVR